MSGICGVVADFTKDCDNPLIGGVQDEILVLNWEDIQAELAETTPLIEFDATTPNKITGFAFTTASGREAYKVDGNMDSVIVGYTPKQLTTGLMYENTAQFQIAGNTAEIDKIVKGFDNAKIVVMVKNKAKTDGKIKIYGFDYGMRRQPENGQSSAENDGAHVLNFKSDESAPEKNPVYTLRAATDALTEAIWVALQTPA